MKRCIKVSGYSQLVLFASRSDLSLYQQKYFHSSVNFGCALFGK